MYRKIIDVLSEDNLQVQLPKEYLNKQVEVIAFELDEDIKGKPAKEFDEAISFFDSLNVDMRNFKFNRDEANER
ncbi:hypothetical protein [Parasediminibacterium sp. JCM 36343]|uniref:hypothetical protein n=1 Tax=Parasediminibacterium sp. JCM 36343 TaxID=3374279 RepID=UPI003978D2CA